MKLRLVALLVVVGLGCVPAEPTGRPAYSFSLPDGGLVEGAKESPVVLVEFGSLRCPYCRQFHDSLFPYLHDRYVSRGKLRFRYVGLDTSEALDTLTAGIMCTSPGVGGAGVVQAAFMAVGDSGARIPGASPSQLVPGSECIESAARRLRAEARAAAEFGVRGSPTFLIGALRPRNEYVGWVIQGLRDSQVVAAVDSALVLLEPD